MQNNTADFAPITLDNLNSVTGGTHPADGGGPAEPTTKHGSGDAPDGPRQGSKPHIDFGKLISDALGKGFKFPFGK